MAPLKLAGRPSRGRAWTCRVLGSVRAWMVSARPMPGMGKLRKNWSKKGSMPGIEPCETMRPSITAAGISISPGLTGVIALRKVTTL